MVIGAPGDPLSVRADLLVLPVNAAGTVGSDAGRLLRRRAPLIWSAVVGDLAATGARPGALIAVPAAGGPIFAAMAVRARVRDWARAADLHRGIRTLVALLRSRPRLRVVSIAPLVREGDEWSTARLRHVLTATLSDLPVTVYLFDDDTPLAPSLVTVRPADPRAEHGLHDRRLDDILQRAERR